MQSGRTGKSGLLIYDTALHPQALSDEAWHCRCRQTVHTLTKQMAKERHSRYDDTGNVGGEGQLAPYPFF